MRQGAQLLPHAEYHFINCRRMVGSSSLGSVEFASKEVPSTLRDAINLRLRQDKDCPGVLLALDEAQGAPIEELVTLGTTVRHIIRDQDASDLPEAEKKGIALVISCLPSMVDEFLGQQVPTFLRRAMREDLSEVPNPNDTSSSLWQRTTLHHPQLQA